jgi:hypothetical protein
MKSKKAIFTFLTILLVCSCKNNSHTKIEISESSKDTTSLVVIAKVQAIEDFQSFLIDFEKDSIFQYKRIIFPLKYSSLNTETDSFDTEIFDENMIKQDNWTFQDFANLPANYLKNVEKIHDDEYEYNIQLYDTGVRVDYIFKLINDKWYLVWIRDVST